MTDLAETTEPLFRPVKKRKFLRKRPEDDLNTELENGPSAPPQQTEQQETPGLSTAPASALVNDDEESTSVSDILRLRKAHKARRGGVEFSASSKSRTHGNAQSTDMVNMQDQEVEKVRAMADRFTVHTGQKVDVDKHMMAYIEAELAKRHQRNMPTEDVPPDSQSFSETVDRQSDPRFLQREPATLGKLHEIDLGHEAKLENIARTEAATRRLVGDAPLSPTEEEAQKKARPGNDGKSWRNRKRRNSEDIERDRLVEEVLRESRLDVYEEPEEQDQPDDQAADDRIAEQFRRDFLDALQSRRRGTRTKPAKAAKQEPPKGPKLGGSRSARAAMRELQEKGQK
ncbi:hypothetical protein NFIA_082890 [Paecilomyces variotii No. 5]|uniref:Hepatocellular carcinoma-associated antigen 59-domain-containing protein n=1 Tax=Byssochlamys spectabilis (strain No. 5 / NBRC 109023) TaxID=1356009 RepID=V5G9G0_BYSSN|nr:hypothetical protein NFIA_082890 [Paecilomyces variotii No. 5]